MNTERTMNSGPTTRSMLRWYPARWRARYGDELAAMIEDDLEGNPPTIRYRLSIARSGLHEQLRDSGLVGNSLPAPEQVRAGALTVLCAFALFVIPGVAFAKISDELRTQYLLAYYPSQKLSNSDFRRIQVSLNGAPGKEAFKVRHRTGYYTSKSE